MSNIIHMHEAQACMVAEKWEAFASAKRRSDETLSLEDGMATGRAWREFLNVYTPTDVREAFVRMDDRMGARR